MRFQRIGFATAVLAACVSGYAAAQHAQPSGSASPTTVTLKDVKGQNVGTVALTQYSAGVLIRGELTNLPPGWHAMHIHEKGVCEGNFDSAGAHLSAQGEQHGLDNPRPHAGDLPNIWVHDDGTAKFEMVATRVALGGARVAGAASTSSGSADGANAVQAIDADGAAIIVHAQRDDHHTDPSGDSHERIACGVLR
jgi:Cu-Zn family superoxide dismutase